MTVFLITRIEGHLQPPQKMSLTTPNKVTWKNLEPIFFFGGGDLSGLPYIARCVFERGGRTHSLYHRGVGFVATTDQMKLESSVCWKMFLVSFPVGFY